MDRKSRWRASLIGHDIHVKRDIYYTYIQDRDDIPHSVGLTIRADMPRTHHDVVWVQQHIGTIEKLLVSYAAIHRGDSYLQGFNYIMANVLYVFHKSTHAEADAWWCFARIVGLVRPLMPDFNVAWFHWLRRHWLNDFYSQLKKHRPRLAAILSDQADAFSSLVTVKWFMIWFAQTVAFKDILELWDFIIEQPPRLLMRVYTMLTYEILYDAAPTLTYRWSQEPMRLMHAFLNFKVTNVTGAIDRVKKKLS
jgi:hypothetical protein|tara:strand:- start:395 stop:1147 length:753 start_codon:yes stop_codon:yes gene_type:complete